MKTNRKAEAITELKKYKDCVFLISFVSMAKSGMSRRYDIRVFLDNKVSEGNMMFITATVAASCGYTYTMNDWRNERGLKVDGCGFCAYDDIARSIARVIGQKEPVKYIKM